MRPLWPPLSRRTLLLGGATLLAAPAAWPQAPGRTYRIGFICQTRRAGWGPLFEELRGDGFVEGKNLVVVGEIGTSFDRYDALAAELVKAGVDAIIANAVPGVRAAQRATQSIPIVSLSDDLVEERFVASLPHPGGNITGVSMLSPELDRKREEILLELVPSARHLATLADPETTPPQQLLRLQEAAGAHHVELSIERATKREEIAPAIEAAKAAGAQAIHVLASVNFYVNRGLVIDATIKARLPAMFQWPEWVELGALAGYGPTLASLFRQAAHQLVKILNGAAPGDVPAEQPTHISLALNLKTAKALGVTVPPSLLVRADEMIE